MIHAQLNFLGIWLTPFPEPLPSRQRKGFPTDFLTCEDATNDAQQLRKERHHIGPQFLSILTSRWSRWHQILCPHLQTWLWCLMRCVMFCSSWNDMCDIFDCVQVSFSVLPHVPITFGDVRCLCRIKMSYTFQTTMARKSAIDGHPGLIILIQTMLQAVRWFFKGSHCQTTCTSNCNPYTPEN